MMVFPSGMDFIVDSQLSIEKIGKKAAATIVQQPLESNAMIRDYCSCA